MTAVRSLIIRTTLVAGTLDILAAFLMQLASHVSPVRVLQAIASGWLGPAAFSGGVPAAALGLVSHFLLMAALVAVYVVFVAGRALARQQPLLCGVLTGIGMYVFMNAVVLPLSRIAFHPNYSMMPVLIGLVVHILCVGMPIAFMARGGQGARVAQTV
ncbi:hypothetical protein AB4Z19_07815 [Pseudoduganella sp. RAF19]|jgi:hypothetical protein